MSATDDGELPAVFEPTSVGYDTHSDRDTDRIKSPRHGLKRISAACQRCRRRKQKCDGRHPVCGSCATANVPCVPSDRLVVKVDRECECDHLRGQVERLKDRVNELQTRLAMQSRLPSEALSQDSHLQIRPAEARRSDRQEPDGSVASLERGYTGRMLLPTFRGLGTNGPEAGFKSGPWQLWNGLSASDTPPTVTSSTFSLHQDGLGLIDIFFDRRWPQYPVLHRPTFMEQHFIPYCNGQISNRLSAFEVHMVLAIGASEKARISSDAPISHEYFFEAAVRDLDSVLAADDLDCIRCLSLLCLFGSNEPQSVNLWYTVGMALRLAVGIDMHREESLAQKTLLDAEMRKRLFWSLYTMDRSVSMSLGRPLGIQDADITIPLPLVLTDGQIAGPSEQPIANLLPDVRDMSAFRHIVELRQINAGIYSALHSAGGANLESANLDAIRQQHYTRLNAWLLSAPRYLAPLSMYQTPEWFQIAYHQAVINLHRPSHASPVSSADAIRLCADSSISLISCYNALYAKNKIIYTFVALDSLFMAAVTMLYSIRASSIVRLELTREVVESNIETCVRLLSKISHGKTVGERSTQIIRRLGNATLSIFDNSSFAEGEIDTEFMSWFGVKSQNPPPRQEYPTPSIDTAWNDLFEHGYDLNSFQNVHLLL
ncbi:fungal-specific transcription factor domain-containing protein [Fusarium avenaceum]|nr:fungal-specific transcription factor domain-containing protein [Fusarium avenaceum]